MSIRSQAELESQYLQRTAQVQSGTLSAEQAFGKMEEWVVQLGQRKALLHPGLKQWMWYDKAHEEWATAGCGIGDAILLTIGNVSGLKKLPQPGDVTRWCVYRQGQEFFGPLRTGELLAKLKSQPDLKDILVWSPQATNWLSVANETGGAISFYDEAGNQISITVKDESAPVGAPSPAAATPAGPRTAPVDIFALSIQLENQRFSMSDQLRLGSEADNDLTLPGQKVSLHHAIIQRRGVVYKITDLNSDSGTYLNGKRITEPTLLRNGDVVLIGDTQLTISDQR
jgi:hypothetical protein